MVYVEVGELYQVIKGSHLYDTDVIIGQVKIDQLLQASEGPTRYLLDVGMLEMERH